MTAKWIQVNLFGGCFVIKIKSNYSGHPSPAHSHFEHFVFFLAFDKAKNAHMGRGALLGSKCMEIKASYVQARRFIDFHTLILNSYDQKNEKGKQGKSS